MKLSNQFSNSLAFRFVVATIAIVIFSQQGAADQPANATLSPTAILSQHCYQCHGPDSRSRQAQLRLDTPEGLWGVIEKGDPEASDLFARITSPDADFRMPPPGHADRLDPQEIAAIGAWIRSGASSNKHWAFQPPQRRELPTVQDTNWAQTPIDVFVLSRLEAEGLSPSPPADRFTLLRRLFLDTTGLAPPVEDVLRWIDERPSPASWDQMIDRRLASPSFGERMAQRWLDAARYADTTGHAADKPRTMWLYRDWVIDALNENLSFDQFTIEQLAGDLLPNPTPQQLIATGFHRNSPQALGNNPRKEEFRVKGIVDRLDTTGRTWLGLTIGCAECHDHKYDPITQREYYQLFAIFNNVSHHGERFDVHGPRLAVLTDDVKQQIDDLSMRQRKLDAQSLGTSEQTKKRQALMRQWLERPWSFASQQQPDVHVYSAEDEAIVIANNEPIEHVEGFRTSEGPLGTIAALRFPGDRAIAIQPSRFTSIQRDFSIGMWVRTGQPFVDLVSQYDWKNKKRSFVFGVGAQNDPNQTPGTLYAWVSSTAEPFRGVEVYGSKAIADQQWHHVAVSFEAGKRITLYIDGEPDANARIKGSVPPRVANSDLPLSIGGGYQVSDQPNACFLNGDLADVRIFGRLLTGRQLGALNDDELQRLNSADLRGGSTSPLEDLFGELMQSLPDSGNQRQIIQQRIETLKKQTVTAQIMDEGQRRETFVHIRGNYEHRGEKVEPKMPHLLASQSTEQSVNRLEFARVLVHRENPLVARVAVNRIWQHYFGRGLVPTSDDFGIRGELPTHPDLLDWLAVEFMDNNWDCKHIHRLILRSATYQQSSDYNETLREVDPENRLLGRANRRRLAAEQIRDHALSVSGMLVERIGGPSVYPPQPEGIGQFRDDTAGKWITSQGADQYRRSLYTFWQRMSPYPSLRLFDVPSREQCSTERPSTNTPLQALVTQNDPHFVFLARKLGERIAIQTGPIGSRIRFAFLLVLSRPPEDEELAWFEDFVMQSPRDPWFHVAQVLLNLDQALTRE